MAFAVFTISSGFREISGVSMGSMFVYTKVHPYHYLSVSYRIYHKYLDIALEHIFKVNGYTFRGSNCHLHFMPTC